MDASHETVFEFSDVVPTEDVRDALEVAVAAMGGVVGSAALRLEADHTLDEAGVVRIDTSRDAGRALARAFLEVASRSLGDGAIKVVRCGRARAEAA
jgi:hypothetical protein